MVVIEQISALIDYLENHQDLALGHFSRTNEGRSLSRRYWIECAQILNSVSVDCPNKTPAEWRTFNICSTDITKNSTIVEEGPRICPLCSSIVRMFYINFFSKIYMCSNTECVYPFEENFTVYSSDDDGLYAGEQFTHASRKQSTCSNRSSKSTRSTGQGSRGTSTLGTTSNLSGSEWAEMSQSSQAYDSDDNVSITSSKTFSRKLSQSQMEKRVKKKKDEQLIKQNVEKIKECNKVLFDGMEEFGTIWNEKWITNLSSMQSSSGMKLVKDHELYKLKKTQNNICYRDVKIDIESKKDTMSSIIIEIDNVALDGKQIKKT